MVFFFSPKHTHATKITFVLLRRTERVKERLKDDVRRASCEGGGCSARRPRWTMTLDLIPTSQPLEIHKESRNRRSSSPLLPPYSFLSSLSSSSSSFWPLIRPFIYYSFSYSLFEWCVWAIRLHHLILLILFRQGGLLLIAFRWMEKTQHKKLLRNHSLLLFHPPSGMMTKVIIQ